MPPQASDKKKRELVEYLRGFSTEVLFTQKEFEKSCPVKVPTQQLKEMLDGVMCEYPLLLDVAKCGSLNVYYMYPAETQRRVVALALATEARVAQAREDIAGMQRQLAEAIAQRGEFRGKAKVLQKHAELHKKHTALVKQLQALQRDDTNWSAERLARERDRAASMRGNLETLADDIDTLVSYLSGKYLVDRATLRRELEVPEQWKG